MRRNDTGRQHAASAEVKIISEVHLRRNDFSRRHATELFLAGPPDSIPAVFAKYFGEKEKKTQKDADDFMKLLGWSD